MIKFIGVGSAFNTRFGNTSGFIQGRESLLLIDCGSSVFHRLMEADLLDGLKDLRVIITHTHPDHVGSLGDLVFYAHHILKIKPRVYFPESSLVHAILELMGVEDHMYDLVGTMEAEEPGAGGGGFRLAFVPVSHMPNIPSFGFYLERGGRRIFYSGDSNRLVAGVLDQLRKGDLDMIYQDTCGLDYPDNVHLSLKRLCQEVPPELRGRVCCSHHDRSLDLDQVREAGFQVAEVWKG
ncbi:MAG: ribonuclease Z [Firmicutes bacterium]|nr:ribonuclease Z [Bacillota bacterium]